MALRVVRLALRLTRWCQDQWNGSTGNLHRKRRDITEQMLKGAYSTLQTKHAYDATPGMCYGVSIIMVALTACYWLQSLT